MTYSTAKVSDSTEPRGPLTRVIVALAMMAIAVLLRWLLDPWLGTNMAFLTVYGAVPCAVWFSGWRPAVLASLLAFLACVYWFVPPRGVFNFNSPYVWGASIGYLFSSGLIIFLGQSARTSRRIAERQSQLLVEELKARRAHEETLERRTRSLEILNRTCVTLSGQLELEKLLQSITDAGREVSGAAFGAFFYNTKDERGESYALYTLSGAPRSAFEGFPMPRNTAVFGPTFRGEGVIRVGDILQDERYGKSAPYHGMPPGHLPVRSYLAAPVASRSGEVIGGLFYGHPDPDIFTAEAEEIVTGIAAQAATALDNARLYQEAQREIAARKEGEAALRAAKDQADAANAAKDRFLAMISHELRTPLNPALMLASVNVEAPNIPEDLRQDFATIRRSLILEARLIDDLLDVSRIIQGKLRLEMANQDLNRLVRRAWEVISSDLEAASVKVQFQLSMQDLVVTCDAVRMQQVIWNLLRNAARHSPVDGIISMSSRKHGATVQLAVSDAGPGIVPADLETIFEPFEEAKAPITANRPKPAGLGLGLAICRGIVSAHGGKIWAESEGQGRGATFIVELPSPGAKS